MLAIFHGDCICDLCVNRNESSERFPLAFDIALWCNCRYQKHVHSIHGIRYTHQLNNRGSNVNLPQTTHQRASFTGVGGAKVENVSSEICRHPCEELVELLTEIQGLRIVTNSLLEDLERVVRQTYVHKYILFFKIHYNM